MKLAVDVECDLWLLIIQYYPLLVFIEVGSSDCCGSHFLDVFESVIVVLSLTSISTLTNSLILSELISSFVVWNISQYIHHRLL